MKQNITAVVLAGGYSSRMQRFKPLLPLNGSTVIANVINNFRKSGIEDIRIVAGHNAEALKHGVDGLDVRVVFNPKYDEGMYSSVVAGIGALEPGVDGCLLMPADMPLVRISTVTRLCSAFDKSGASVVYPVFQKRRGHPTLISSRLFSEIVSGSGAGGLRVLLAGHDGEAHEERVPDEGILIDLDIHADYEKAQERIGQLDIPTLNECEAILDEMAVFENIRCHGRRVAEVAEKLAVQLNDAGLHLNVALVKAAAVLHDLAKGRPEHARAGAQILDNLGFPELGRVVGLHMDGDFQKDAPLGETAGGETAGGAAAVDEAAIVYLVDKMVQGDRIVSLAERFQRAFKTARGNGSLSFVQKRWETAQRIREAVEHILGADIRRIISPQSDVRGAMVGDAHTH